MAAVSTILLVDDDPLAGPALRRLWWSLRTGWEVHHVCSGAEALDWLRQHRAEVVLTDLEMTRLDGAELLEVVRERYPEMVRLVLSGTSDHDLSVKASRFAHRLLAKPCDAVALRATIDAILRQREMLRLKQVLDPVVGLDHLPSTPGLCLRLVRELEAADGGMDSVVALLQQDLGLCTKVLKLVNSGFFGLPEVVSNVQEAATFLGFEVLRAVVLFSGVPGATGGNAGVPFSIEALSAHSLRVGRTAQRLSEEWNLAENVRRDAFTAGMLHDIGKLILGSYRPETYAEVLAEAGSGRPLPEAEREAFGASHSEIGSMLLDLWGMPATLVEAVAFHDQPSRCLQREAGLLAVVHVANGLSHAAGEAGGGAGSFDLEFLEVVGLGPRMEALGVAPLLTATTSPGAVS